MISEGSEEDAALVKRALAGDDRAFTLIMRRHKAPLYRAALRYTNCAEDAYDIVQQAFLSAWKALPRFDPAKPLAAWLRAITLNKCRDHGRRKMVRRWLTLSPVDRDGREMDAPTPDPDAEQIVSDRLALESAKTAIAALPDGLKAPLVLVALEGLSMSEAGEVLGLTAKAVENRLYRARARLRIDLER